MEKQAGKTYLLCFEGVNYGGVPELNGHAFEFMLPYSEYQFDVSAILKDGTNTLKVHMRDIGLAYGPSDGWRNYAGIVRSVYILVTEETYVRDVFFHTAFSEDCQKAVAAIEVQAVNCPNGINVDAVLTGFGLTYRCDAAVMQGKAVLTLDVEQPMLWSPENPNLYDLTVTVKEDTFSLKVGFKDFKIQGDRFFLNGKPCFLSGVCRHDLQTDACGFTQTDEQIEKDMRLIKAMGANFVRLVHYPHDKRVLEMADRLGLFVSEEPGLWWADLKDPAVTEPALQVFERVILRDRSHVSVAFWLCFNECIMTPEFPARRSKNG